MQKWEPMMQQKHIDKDILHNTHILMWKQLHNVFRGPEGSFSKLKKLDDVVNAIPAWTSDLKFNSNPTLQIAKRGHLDRSYPAALCEM